MSSAPPLAPDAPPLLHPVLARDWKLLRAATFLFAFGFSIYGAVFINFITQHLGVTPFRMGVLESSREVPGLLAVAIAAAAAAFAETRIGAMCLVFSALGVGATGFVHTFPELVVVTVFWSVFMHQWFTSSSSIPLALAGGLDGGMHLGRMGAWGAAGTVLGLVTLHPLAGHLPWADYFLLAAGFIFAAGLLLLPMSEHGTTRNRPRLLYRREYGLYYGLSFLEGCRRQIFTTFAIFALVQVCRVSVAQIASLLLLNAVATLLVAAPAGRWIDRVGERHVMGVYYIAIALAFSGYALSRNTITLEILYVIDNILFSLGVSITTYLNKVVRPGEMTATLAMGQTMNHVAAVAVPVAGGLLWSLLGYHAPFWAGAAAALVSLALTRRVVTSALAPANFGK